MQLLTKSLNIQDIRNQKLKLHTPLGHILTATVFIPNVSLRKTVVINGATGVPQRFYSAFADFLAQNGFHVVTYDYYGIGESKKGRVSSNPANYRTWAQYDYPSVVKRMQQEFPNNDLYLIGHSFGGNCLGQTKTSLEFKRIITIASQFGYWRYFDRKKTLYVMFKFIMPALSYVLGYFPSRWFGMGEALPEGAALDWCQVILHPDSVRSLTTKIHYFDDIKSPMLMISFADDWQAPKLAVDKLAEIAYPNAPVSRLHITPAEIGVKTIGHIDFFRKKFESNLWQLVLKELVKG